MPVQYIHAVMHRRRRRRCSTTRRLRPLPRSSLIRPQAQPARSAKPSHARGLEASRTVHVAALTYDTRSTEFDNSVVYDQMLCRDTNFDTPRVHGIT